MKVLARGVLGSGLFNATPSADGNDPNDAKLRLVLSLRSLAESVNVTPHQLAVWWALAQPSVSTMLVGINSIDHLRSTVRYATTALPDTGLVDRIEQLIELHATHGGNQ